MTETRRVNIFLTNELADLLYSMAAAKNAKIGPTIEILLRTHATVRRAAKLQGIEFGERPKAGRPWVKKKKEDNDRERS